MKEFNEEEANKIVAAGIRITDQVCEAFGEARINNKDAIFILGTMVADILHRMSGDLHVSEFAAMFNKALEIGLSVREVEGRGDA